MKNHLIRIFSQKNLNYEETKKILNDFNIPYVVDSGIFSFKYENTFFVYSPNGLPNIRLLSQINFHFYDGYFACWDDIELEYNLLNPNDLFLLFQKLLFLKKNWIIPNIKLEDFYFSKTYNSFELKIFRYSVFDPNFNLKYVPENILYGKSLYFLNECPVTEEMIQYVY